MSKSATFLHQEDRSFLSDSCMPSFHANVPLTVYIVLVIIHVDSCDRRRV